MTASATCRRPGEQTDTVRLPASPVLLAGAALMQRLLASGQRKRSRGREEQAGARMRRGAQRKYTGGPNNAEAAPGEAEEEASASPGDEHSVGRERAAERRQAQAGSCRHGRSPKSRRRCCSTPRRFLSMVVAGGSVALMVRGVQELTSARTTLDPHAPETSSQLVTTGPFAYTRNPLYLAGAGLLWAHALWLGSPRALLPAGAFVLALDKCQIPLEEAALEQRFGKKYRKYAAEVPRWVAR